MKRVKITLALIGALAVLGGAAGLPSQAAPITKQNGKAPAFDAFTSICAVSGYASYGDCGGSTATFANVTGRINAVQAKPGRYNLGFSFEHLTPGRSYRLWGNDGNGWFEIGTAPADAGGGVKFDYQTTSPAGLGFDLNFADPNVTVVTSYWSGQRLAMNADGTLYAS